MNGRTVTTLLATLLVSLAGIGQAHPPDSGMGMMTDRGGSGGTGMMGGSMMDMMGPGMMGQGMTAGSPGSMMGRGMMGAGLARILQLPDLSDGQRETLTTRHRELQRQLLGLEQKALEAEFVLQDAAAGDTPDPKAVGRALQGVFDVRRQMVEATVAAHNDVRAVLTDEQLEALEERGRGMGMSGMRARMMQDQ